MLLLFIIVLINTKFTTKKQYYKRNKMRVNGISKTKIVFIFLIKLIAVYIRFSKIWV